MSKRNMMFLLVSLFVLVSAVPAFAQSDTISIDTGVFISQINNWLGMAIGVIAIGVGIAGAFALAQFVGSMIINAFNGRVG